MKSKKILKILFFIVILVIAATMVGMFVFTGKNKEEKLKIGFVMSGSVDEQGWKDVNHPHFAYIRHIEVWKLYQFSYV